LAANAAHASFAGPRSNRDLELDFVEEGLGDANAALGRARGIRHSDQAVRLQQTEIVLDVFQISVDQRAASMLVK
jgi:hypothetical protein